MDHVFSIIITFSALLIIWSYITSNYKAFFFGLNGVVLGSVFFATTSFVMPKYMYWIIGLLILSYTFFNVRNIMMLKRGQVDGYLKQFDDE